MREEEVEQGKNSSRSLSYGSGQKRVVGEQRNGSREPDRVAFVIAGQRQAPDAVLMVLGDLDMVCDGKTDFILCASRS